MQIILNTREEKKIRKEESGSGKKSFKKENINMNKIVHLRGI